MNKALILAVCISTATGCANNSSPAPTPTYDYNTDVRVGLEAATIGNWSLARTFLESALKADERAQDGGLVDPKVRLSHAAREDAAETLARTYYEQGDRSSLFDLLQKYWPLERGWIESESHRSERLANQRYQYRWYCQLLDDRDRFSEAQACWNKVGYPDRARASIRAMEMQDVFGRN